jgi:hypothetical protein
MHPMLMISTCTNKHHLKWADLRNLIVIVLSFPHEFNLNQVYNLACTRENLEPSVLELGILLETLRLSVYNSASHSRFEKILAGRCPKKPNPGIVARSHRSHVYYIFPINVSRKFNRVPVGAGPFAGILHLAGTGSERYPKARNEGLVLNLRRPCIEQAAREPDNFRGGRETAAAWISTWFC